MYGCYYFKNFNFSENLKDVKIITRKGNCKHSTYLNSIIMIDTETSKKSNKIIDENHIVAFTLSFLDVEKDGVLFTLYGNRPSELCDVIWNIRNTVESDKIIIYIHNLNYDWTFLQRFFIEQFGIPDKQLNIKPHQPLFVNFLNGIELRDSLILAQRSLAKWGDELNVKHKKSVGKWKYNTVRNQSEKFTKDELEYIEHDTLCGVECINTLRKQLNKTVYSMPYTNTGIVREKMRKEAKKHDAHRQFLRIAATYEQYRILLLLFHGGYTHANRNYANVIFRGTLVKCFDFSSSYPYVLLTEKYPMGAFEKVGLNYTIDEILEKRDRYAYMFKLILVGVKLKNNDIEMPCLSYSKCIKSINTVCDNGRILCADYIEIYTNEIDLVTIAEQYTYYKHICTDVYYAFKDFLPQWFTDFIFELFKKKTELKGGDKVEYAIAKAMLNACYGMTVQKPIRETYLESYDTFEYYKKQKESEDENAKMYSKYLNSRNSVLPYQWGVWCTAYAQKNLFELGKCVGTWIYSDTDSIYGTNWNMENVTAYNDKCKQKLRKRGYTGVSHGGREYWLGVAEHDRKADTYHEFVAIGAKRYCGRNFFDKQLHITVAGVPKIKGARCLKDNIENFKKGFIFDGKTSGKNTVKYFLSDIHIDENGNEVGDSIDLSPCDYLLDDVKKFDWESLISDEIELQIYDEV